LLSLVQQMCAPVRCYADSALDATMQQMAAKQSVTIGSVYEDFNDRDFDFMGVRCNYRTHVQGYVELSLPVPVERATDGTAVAIRVELHPEPPQIYGRADAADECPAALTKQRFSGSAVLQGGTISAGPLASSGGEFTAELEASLPGSGQNILARVILTDRKIRSSPIDMSFILSKRSAVRTVPAAWDS